MRHAMVGLFMTHSANETVLLIPAAHPSDPGCGAQWAVAPIAGNDDRGVDRTAIGQRRDRPPRAVVDRCHTTPRAALPVRDRPLRQAQRVAGGDPRPCNRKRRHQSHDGRDAEIGAMRPHPPCRPRRECRPLAQPQLRRDPKRRLPPKSVVRRAPLHRRVRQTLPRLLPSLRLHPAGSRQNQHPPAKGPMRRQQGRRQRSGRHSREICS